MSANFTQVSGPGGRTQSLTPGAAAQTYIWNPASLKGQLDGGDFIYAKRIKVRTTGVVTASTGPVVAPPNWEIMAQSFGQCRVFSQFLGELFPRNNTSVPLLANHDMYFVNGFRPITRKRGQTSGVATNATTAIEYVFELPFEREYLMRSTDSIPWMPFLEGGIIEVDLAPTTSLSNWGFTTTSTWQQTCTIDWYCDKQALIPTPVHARLYRVTTTPPEFVLKSVGSPQGLDGVMPGSRLAVLSWLMKGNSSGTSTTLPDNGYYAAFGTGGLQLGTNALQRLDVPFRNQASVDDVNAWFESFISDTRPIPMLDNLNALGAVSNDMAGWPFIMDPNMTGGSNKTTFITDNANFYPLIWPGALDKISDFQKVNGDLSFTATFGTPGSSVLNLFRTDEVCSYTMAKVYDIMQRMGLPHKDTGGAYTVVPKYESNKRADDTTRWGFPLKIVEAR